MSISKKEKIYLCKKRIKDWKSILSTVNKKSKSIDVNSLKKDIERSIHYLEIELDKLLYVKPKLTKEEKLMYMCPCHSNVVEFGETKSELYKVNNIAFIHNIYKDYKDNKFINIESCLNYEGRESECGGYDEHELLKCKNCGALIYHTRTCCGYTFAKKYLTENVSMVEKIEKC